REIVDRVVDAKLRQLSSKKPARDLRQHARAVAALAVGRHTATMGHIADRRERHANNRVARLAGQLGDKTDTTSVVLKTRVIQAASCCFLEGPHLYHPSTAPNSLA